MESFAALPKSDEVMYDLTTGLEEGVDAQLWKAFLWWDRSLTGCGVYGKCSASIHGFSSYSPAF
jgi:hypothetical protein